MNKIPSPIENGQVQAIRYLWGNQLPASAWVFFGADGNPYWSEHRLSTTGRPGSIAVNSNDGHQRYWDGHQWNAHPSTDAVAVRPICWTLFDANGNPYKSGIDSLVLNGEDGCEGTAGATARHSDGRRRFWYSGEWHRQPEPTTQHDETIRLAHDVLKSLQLGLQVGLQHAKATLSQWQIKRNCGTEIDDRIKAVLQADVALIRDALQQVDRVIAGEPAR